jgi:hypothetical protein
VSWRAYQEFVVDSPREDSGDLEPGRVDDLDRAHHEPLRDPLARRDHGAPLDRGRNTQRPTVLPRIKGYKQIPHRVQDLHSHAYPETAAAAAADLPLARPCVGE